MSSPDFQAGDAGRRSSPRCLPGARLPIAYSARCYTARAHKVPKDACGYCCIDYPDGLMLSTREDEDFLVINGIQTQSAKVCNLVHALRGSTAGADIFRLSPQSEHTPEVISLFDQTRKGALMADEATEELKALVSDDLCNGYWFNQAGMASHSAVWQSMMRRPSQIIQSTLASLTEENRSIYQSQREFLRFLERQGDLKRIQVPVSPAFEMTEICHRTLKAAGPALLFEKPTEGNFPVVGNLYGTENRVAATIGLKKCGRAARVRQATGFPEITGPCQKAQGTHSASYVNFAGSHTSTRLR